MVVRFSIFKIVNEDSHLPRWVLAPQGGYFNNYNEAFVELKSASTPGEFIILPVCIKEPSYE